MKANHLKFLSEPALDNPPLIVTWTEDAGGLGPGVADFLIERLGAERFCRIEPLGFFPLGEVEVKDDLIRFPESDFYSSEGGNIIVLRALAPRYEWHRFLSLILDVAAKYRVKEFYSIGGMVSLATHTSPRRIMSVTSTSRLKQELAPYGFYSDMDFRTPPGGRPTLGSFLLWLAQRRDIPGANLWVETPFYMTAVNDYGARAAILDFIIRKLGLGLDTGELAAKAAEQDSRIKQLRADKPEIESSLARLERGEALAQEEGETLVSEIQQLLGKS